MMFSCCLMCICKNITEEMSVYNAFLLIYIYTYHSLGLFMLIPILLDQLCTTSRLVQSLSSDFSG